MVVFAFLLSVGLIAPSTQWSSQTSLYIPHSMDVELTQEAHNPFFRNVRNN